MAIVNPASDVSRAMLTARTKAGAMFPPTTSDEHDFEMGLDARLVQTIPDRITEPLGELDAPLDEVGDSLLSDTAEESSDIDALEDIP